MPNRSLALAVTLLATLTMVPATSAQTQSANDVGEGRRERIADNLKLRFEQLREANVVVTELSEADLEGFDIGTVVINGRNVLRFLVTRDDTRLFLLAADAVDVSMTKAEVEAEFKRLEREALAAARQRHEQLMVLSKGKPSLGKGNAPITIVEFSDFECPYCARVVPTVKQVLDKYPDDVRLVFMHLPLSMHPWAEPAAVAATCAARQSQDAFWSLHDYYFENQDRIEVDNLVEVSRERLADSGLNLDTWTECAGDTGSEAYEEALSSVRSSAQAAEKYGATGTPAFFINGRFLDGAQPLSAFDELIRDILKKDA